VKIKKTPIKSATKLSDIQNSMQEMRKINDFILNRF